MTALRRNLRGHRFILVLLLVSGMSWPRLASAAVGFVQVNAATPHSSQSTINVTYANAQSAGNLNVIAIAWGDTTHAVSSVTDTKGNSYTQAVGLTINAAGGLSQTIYYARNIAAATAGSNVVTVTLNGAAAFPDVRILEYTGLDLTAPVDVTSSGTGSGTTSSTATITTTNAADLLFAANVVSTKNTAAGSGFTSRIISADGNIAEDRLVAAVGNYNATATLNSGQWVAQMVAFRAAPTGPDITPPSVPANLTATPVNATQVNLAWTASTDNVGVVGYQVERCQGSACTDFAQILTPTGTSVSDTGVVQGTTYNYRVRATDGAGNLSGYSNTAPATTPAPDTIPPSAPANLTATAVSATQINLAWTASTDDVAVTGYRIERCQGVGCTNFVQVLTATGTSVSDTGLTSGTSYSYRVLAVDGSNNLSQYSNVATASPLDTTKPTAPTGLTATAINSTQIDLSWTASTDNVGVVQYRIERCQGSGCTNFVQVLTSTGTSASDTGLAASTRYRYRVRAADAAGNLSSYSSTVAATTKTSSDTTPPSAPASLTATAASGTQIDLSWSASTDNVGVTGYRVERCQGVGCSNFAQVLTPTGTTVSNTGLTNGTSYSYRVRAVDAAGNLSPYSNVASATTPDTAAPTAPTGLTATAPGTTQINLSWAASTDNVGVAGYRVERCQGAGCTNFVQVLTPTGTSVSDTGLTAATTYLYRVRAVDAAGNLSGYSNIATGTTQTVPDTTPPTIPANLAATAASGTQINLAWTASTDNIGVTGYRVERCQGTGCTNFAQVSTPAGNSASDTGLTTATTYNYRVRAVDAAGNLSDYSNVATATTLDTAAPTPPTGLNASAASTTQIDLSWTASTDNVGVTGYRLERCQGTGCSNFTQVATPSGTSASDTGLTPGTTYVYRVRATDAAGNLSAYSAIASATTQSPPDTTPPSDPVNLTATAPNGTQVNLAWTASTDNLAVTGYLVERCQGSGCSNFAQVATPTGNSLSDTGLTSGTSYSYRVRATDAAGNLSGYSNVASATPTIDSNPPTSPTNLTATAVSTSQINLTWTASTDNVGVTGYRVERCQGPGCSNFAQILTPTGTNVSDTGLTASTSYSYRVRATDAAGNLGAYSSTVTATTFVASGNITFVQVKGNAPHSDQTSVSAAYTNAQSAGNLNVVVIGWGDTTHTVVSVTDSKGNVYAPAVGPTVNSAGGLSQSIFYAANIAAAAAGANTVTVSFDGPTPYPDLRLLEYSGVDVNTPVDVVGSGTGTGSTSSTASVTTTNAADLLVGANVVATVTTAAGTGFTNRLISTDGNIAEDRIVTAVGNYTATAALNAGQWLMQMVAFRASGSPPPPLDTTPPTAPSGLSASALGTQVNLTWFASTDNVGVTGYRLERCQGNGCSNFVQIATPTGTTFADTGLLTSTNYSYRVRATDAAANLSGYSNTASATTSTSASNPIVLENQLPGSSAWQLGDVYGRPYANDTVKQIKGYASATSINKGESIVFHVSVNTAQTYTIDVYRMGWYGGLGGRLMQHIGPLDGVQQPTCPTNASTGMIECNWSASYTLATQDTWTSGIYLAVLKNAQNFYNYIVFTMRDDSRIAALLYQQPVTTYQAYNDYPDDGSTGKSLYEHNSFGANTLAGTVRAVKVSFDRPYSDDGAGTFIWLSEINLVRWMEKSGYDVTYSTDVDTHENGSRLLNFRGFLSVPHDEYWSKPMYDAAIAARDAGVNLAFFGANSIFWQVRLEPSTSGATDRVLVCYKDVNLDPTTDSTVKTVQWRQPPVNRPEQALAGVEFTDGPNSGTASYVVLNSGNWVWGGTGLVDGTVIPGLVWYEADRQVVGDPLPTSVPGTYTLLSNSPYAGSQGAQISNSSIYQAPSGAWVFATGTMGWGWGLDNFYPEGSVNTVDSRIQKATANVLDRFGGR